MASTLFLGPVVRPQTLNVHATGRQITIKAKQTTARPAGPEGTPHTINGGKK